VLKSCFLDVANGPPKLTWCEPVISAPESEPEPKMPPAHLGIWDWYWGGGRWVLIRNILFKATWWAELPVNKDIDHPGLIWFSSLESRHSGDSQSTVQKKSASATAWSLCTVLVYRTFVLQELLVVRKGRGVQLHVMDRSRSFAGCKTRQVGYTDTADSA